MLSDKGVSVPVVRVELLTMASNIQILSEKEKSILHQLTSQACILWCPLPPLSQLEFSYCTLHPLKCILRLSVKNCFNIFFKIDIVGCLNYLFMCQDRYKNKHKGKRFCSFSIMHLMNKTGAYYTPTFRTTKHSTKYSF